MVVAANMENPLFIIHTHEPFYTASLRPPDVLRRSTYRGLFYGSGAGFPTDHKFKV
jgi:hypothetical protein